MDPQFHSVEVKRYNCLDEGEGCGNNEKSGKDAMTANEGTEQRECRRG